MFASAEDQGLYPAEDYALYDRIWQRVSPELDPYPEIRAAAQAGAAVSPPPQPVLERREQPDSAGDLERLMGEELAGSQHCRQAAKASGDPCLCRLLAELERQALDRAAAVRTLLENVLR